MAFVYSQERWVDKENLNPGPGSYWKEQIKKTSRKKLTYRKKSYPLQSNPTLTSQQNKEKAQICHQQKIIRRKKREHPIVKEKLSTEGSSLIQESSTLQVVRKNNPKNKCKCIRRRKYVLPTQTSPSIKGVQELNFFIGKKREQPVKRNRKIKAKTIDKLEKKVHKKDANFQEEVTDIFADKIKRTQSTKGKSRNPLFDKKQLLKMCQKMQTPTGISEQSDDQGEYILEATPGPGSYNFTKPKTTKKNMMFTAARSRFQKNNCDRFQLDCYNAKEPNFKKSSKVCQKKVAFGRTKDNKQECSSPPKKEPGNFYENYKSIANQGVKMMIQNTAKNRQLKNQLSFPDFLDIQSYVRLNQLDLQEASKENQKLTSPFASKIAKLETNRPETANIDYLNQNHLTIKKNLEKQKENLDKVGFMKNVPTEQKIIEEKKKAKTDLEVKHGLIQTKNGYRQRQSEEIHIQRGKGFTIGKKAGQTIKSQNFFPSPDTYDISKSWMIPSHNKKFKNS